LLGAGFLGENEPIDHAGHNHPLAHAMAAIPTDAPPQGTPGYAGPAFSIAVLCALAGSVGSVYLSVAMGLKACPLCFYQRTLMLAVLAVLVLGLVTDRSRAAFAAVLCVPLAMGGLLLAAFHQWLVVAGTLECPLGLLGLGTAPAQSLAIFLPLTACLLVAARPWPRGIAGGIVLGLPLAWASIVSAPPMPPVPSEPYTQPLEICRPPFRGPE
jgi:disulfide bond formation protein DsbB